MAEGDEAVVEVVGDGVDAHGKDGDDAVAREGEGGAGPGEPDVPEDVAYGRPGGQRPHYEELEEIAGGEADKEAEGFMGGVPFGAEDPETVPEK